MVGIISGVVSVIFYVVSVMVLNVNSVLAIVPSAVVFGAVYLISNYYKKPKQIELVHHQAQMKYEENRKILKQIQKDILEIKDVETKQQATKACEKAERIIEMMEKEPEKARNDKLFSIYFLRTFQSLVSQYVDINDQGIKEITIRPVNERLVKKFELLENAFEKILLKLLEDDFMDLEVEMDVLEKMVKSEGLE